MRETASGRPGLAPREAPGNAASSRRGNRRQRLNPRHRRHRRSRRPGARPGRRGTAHRIIRRPCIERGDGAIRLDRHGAPALHRCARGGVDVRHDAAVDQHQEAFAVIRECNGAGADDEALRALTATSSAKSCGMRMESGASSERVSCTNRRRTCSTDRMCRSPGTGSACCAASSQRVASDHSPVRPIRLVPADRIPIDSGGNAGRSASFRRPGWAVSPLRPAHRSRATCPPGASHSGHRSAARRDR